MDIEIYVLYEALFVVIFLGLLFSLTKELGDSKIFPSQKKGRTMMINKRSLAIKVPIL